MHSNGVCFKSFLFYFVIAYVPLGGILKYQQEVTISSFRSEEVSKDMANQFLRAADGDPDLKVVDIKYEQEKLGDNLISYNAIIMCHVSKSDVDVLRVQEKMIKNNDNLIRGNPKLEAR